MTGSACPKQPFLTGLPPASSGRSVWVSQRVVPGPLDLQPRAWRRAGRCPVYPLGPVVDSQCHAPSLLITVYALLGHSLWNSFGQKKGGGSTTPSALLCASCLLGTRT